MPLNKDDNLVFQSYCTTIFMIELAELKFVESEDYQKLEFQDKRFQNYFGKELPFLNQGTFLMFFYALLVVPKEVIFEEYREEFTKVGKWVKSIAINIEHKENGVLKELPNDWVISKVRNSISHATVDFNENTVSFLDKKKGAKFQTEIIIPLPLATVFIKLLQGVFLKYINSPRIRRN